MAGPGGILRKHYNMESTLQKYQNNSPKKKKQSFLFFLKVALVGLVLLGALGVQGCGEDPNEFPREYAEYIFFCPWLSKEGCYSAWCGATYDLDGSGNIEPVEQPNYDSCTAQCDSRCDTSFWLLLID